MKAIVVTDEAAGPAGMTLVKRPVRPAPTSSLPGVPRTADAVAALNPTERRNGKTIIRIRP
jgi:hypothetical protein